MLPLTEEDIDSEESDDDDNEYEEDDDEEDEEAIARREARKKRKEQKKKRPDKKTIYDLFEPSELERGHLTDKDNIIKRVDIPERFQLRSIPVTATRPDPEDRSVDDEILIDEAKWIYQHAFCKPTISQQVFYYYWQLSCFDEIFL